MEVGTTVTIATGPTHGLRVGDEVTVAGVAVAGYNGTWTVTAVPTTRSFQYTNTVSGLGVSGGGTATPTVPGAGSQGTTATIRTTLDHGRSVGDNVTISGVGVGGYNGTFAITAVPSPRTFQYTIASQLGNSGGGTSTYYSGFRVRIGGNNSVLIGGNGLAYNDANLTSAINAISGFPGTVTVTGAAAPGFTISYSGASAGLDVPNVELVERGCTCFASVQETNHGGAMDSFRLNYNGTVSDVITNGGNYSAAGIQAALLPILPAGATATVAAFGGGSFNNTGFQVTYGGNAGRDECSGAARDPGLHRGRVGLHRRDGQGRPDRQRRHRHADREHRSGPDRSAQRHDPTANAVRSHGERSGRRRATRSTTRGNRTTSASEPVSLSSTT